MNGRAWWDWGRSLLWIAVAMAVVGLLPSADQEGDAPTRACWLMSSTCLVTGLWALCRGWARGGHHAEG